MRYLIIFFLLVSCAVAADLPDTTLTGEMTQGGLIVGTTKPGSTVKLNDQNLKVTRDGKFVFGFDRDAKLSSTLTITPPESAPVSQKLTVTQRQYDIQRINGLPKRKVNPTNTDMQRITHENKKLAKARKTDSDLTGFAQQFIQPAQGTITGVFGSQRILNTQPRRPHMGLDIAGPIGTPIHAPADAKVILAANDMFFNGNTLLLDHGHGVQSIMIHLDEILVKNGQMVKRGEKIAKMGKTGRATGSHLHWGVTWQGVNIDPALLIHQ